MRGDGRARAVLGAVLLGGVLSGLLGGCSVRAPQPTSAPPSATPSEAPRPTASASEPAVPVVVPVQPSGEPGSVAEGLDAPWSILRMTADSVSVGSDSAPGSGSGSDSTAAPAVTTADGTALPDGTTLLSERDSGDVLELLTDGTLRVAGTVAGVAAGGEGGLLGLAARAAASAGEADSPGTWVYAYFTSESDNRIVRMPLQGSAGALALGPAELVTSGLPRAANHDGGRIAFGPDGMLYATAGDAGNRDGAQNPDYLGGKILRMTPTGAVPAGNPYGTLVWSLGHRNPQGIGWDSSGRLWAAEFGQDTWDELNQVTPGGNYGWPVVEGAAGDARFTDPVLQWPTDEASPSGLAVVNDTVFIAALRGERVWRWAPDSGQPPSPWFVGQFGRIRDVAAGPDGTLWFLSNNTDGRGSPRSGDDHLWQVALVPAAG